MRQRHGRAVPRLPLRSTTRDPFVELGDSQRSRSRVGVLTRVIVDVGFELVALVTRQATEDLQLAVGSDVFAVFKASAVHLIVKGT